MPPRPSTLAFVGALLIGGANAQDAPRDQAGFTDYVANALRQEVGGEAVVIEGPLTIRLGKLQANLDRIYKFCSSNTSACSAEIERYVKGAAEVHRERNAPPTKEAIRVVVRSSQYIQSVSSTVDG